METEKEKNVRWMAEKRIINNTIDGLRVFPSFFNREKIFYFSTRFFARSSTMTTNQQLKGTINISTQNTHSFVRSFSSLDIQYWHSPEEILLAIIRIVMFKLILLFVYTTLVVGFVFVFGICMRNILFIYYLNRRTVVVTRQRTRRTTSRWMVGWMTVLYTRRKQKLK